MPHRQLANRCGVFGRVTGAPQWSQDRNHNILFMNMTKKTRWGFWSLMLAVSLMAMLPAQARGS
jgi:hypothetical protein